MPICKSCGLKHDGWVPCAKARYLVVNKVANTREVVANGPTLTVAIKPGVSRPLVSGVGVGEAVADRRDGRSRHGKYADLEKRKTYMREYMRKRRAV